MGVSQVPSLLFLDLFVRHGKLLQLYIIGKFVGTLFGPASSAERWGSALCEHAFSRWTVWNLEMCSVFSSPGCKVEKMETYCAEPSI